MIGCFTYRWEPKCPEVQKRSQPAAQIYNTQSSFPSISDLTMAPSIAETVTTTIDQTSNGITKLNLRQDKPSESTKKDVSTENI